MNVVFSFAQPVVFVIVITHVISVLRAIWDDGFAFFRVHCALCSRCAGWRVPTTLVSKGTSTMTGDQPDDRIGILRSLAANTVHVISH